MSIRKIFSRLPALLAAIFFLPGICFSSTSEITSISQLNDPRYRVGSDSGGPVLERTRENFPNAQILKYNDFLSEYLALQSGRIDALTANESEFISAVNNGLEHVRILPGYVGKPVPTAAGLSDNSKIPGLKEKFNAFIAGLKSDGTLSAMYKRWVYDNDTNMPAIDVPENSDIHLTIATTGVVMPFSFFINSDVTGFDVELGRRFAAYLGATVEFKIYGFGSILMAIKSGAVDIALSNLYVTKESAESVTFSDVVFDINCIAAVYDENKTPAIPKNETGNFEAFRGKRIGVPVGSVISEMVKERIPDAEIYYFDMLANFIAAIESRKIDAFAMDEPIIYMLERENSRYTHYNGNLGSVNNAFIFSKSPENNPLADEINEYIRRMRSDGTLDEIRAIWFGGDESRKTVPDYKNFPGTKGTIRIAINNDTPPFSYIKDGRLAGYDIDVILRFCKDKGYRPDFSEMNFSSVLPAVSSRKCDIGIGAISMSEERAASVRFSEPVCDVKTLLLILKSSELNQTLQNQTADSESKLSETNRSSESKLSESQPPTQNRDSQNAGTSRKPKYKTLAELDGKTIGVQTGVFEWADFVEKTMPRSQIVYFNTFADIAAALKTHKIEAFLVDEPVYNLMASEDKNLARIDAKIDDIYDIAYGFPKNAKGKKLCDEMSEYIRRIKASGELEAVIAKWEESDESAKTLPDYKHFPAPNGILTMATEGEYPPFNYYRGNEIAGLEIDIAARFCKSYGYGLEITSMAWDSIISAIVSGKFDFAGAYLDTAEAHTDNIYFSEPYAHGRSVMACLKAEDLPVQAVSKNNKSVPKYKSFSELDGKTIGMQPGIIEWEEWAAKNLPHSKIQYYNTYPDLVAALKTHKIEGLLIDFPVLALMAAEDKTLAYIDEPVGKPFGYSFFYAQTEAGKKLCDEMSEYIRKIKASGELDAILSKWQGADESAKIPPDFKSLPAKNGTLTYAAEGSYPPFSYYKGTKLAGIDIDIAAGFCREYGYGLGVQMMLFDATIPAINSGKVDFAGDFTPSEEHEESVYFSEPYCNARSVIACLRDESQTVSKTPSLKLSDFDGKPVGIQSGVPALETFARKFFPHSQVHYYNTYTDIAAAVKAGKIASFIVDSPVLELMSAEDPRLSALGENIDEGYDIAYGFPKTEAGKKLRDEMSEYIRGLKSSGELQALIDRWTGADESAKVVPDYKKFPAHKGVLRMATEGEYAPMNYFKGNNFAGIDIDLAARFCEAKGYGLEITAMSYGAIVPAVASGRFDFAGADLNPTPENVEVLNFSEPYYRSSHVVAYLNTDSQQKSSEFDSLAGKRIGVQTGTTCAELVPEKIPSARLSYYDSLTDEITALKAGKVDAICCSLPAAIFAGNEDSRLTRINPPLRETYLYPIFARTEKGRRLCDEYSEFLKGLWDDGTIDALNAKWLGKDEGKKTLDDYSQLPSTNGTMKMAVDASMIPFAYVRDNKIVGYDIDLAVRFCRAKGYSLEVENMTFTGVIASVKTGKCDFTQSMNQTPERAENTLFTSTPAIKSGNVLLTMKTEKNPYTVNIPLSDFAGKRVGLLIGSDSAKAIEDKIPGVKLRFFDAPGYVLPALRSGRIDAFYCAEPTAVNIIQTNGDLAYIPDYVSITRHTTMFPKTAKGRKLCAEYADFLKTLSDDGTIDMLAEKWISGTDDSRQTTEDYSHLPATNGTLTLSVTEGLMPFVFMKDKRIQGYDIDLAVLFCKHKGCGLKIEITNHNGVLSSLNTGKCDFSYSVQWTKERDNTVLFSPVPNAITGSVLLVMRPLDYGLPSVNMTLSNFARKKIGVVTGTNNAIIVKEKIPSANLVYYESPADTLMALKQGKIDALSCGSAASVFLMRENDGLARVSEPVRKNYHFVAFVSSDKGRNLRNEYGEFLKTLWSDGTIKKLYDKWIWNYDESTKTEDYSRLPSAKGTLKMAADPAMVPFVFSKNNRIMGYDIDLAVMFCKARGYGLELVPMSHSGVIASLASGKCDFSYSIEYTEERAKSILFSEVPNVEADNILVVLKPAVNMNLSELNGKTIGVTVGTNHDSLVSSKIPGAEIKYFSDPADMLAALKAGKIDAFANTLPTAEHMLHENKELAYLPEHLSDTDYFTCFADSDEGRKLCAEYSEFVKNLWDKGVISQLTDKWLTSENDSLRVTEDYSKLPAVNGTLTMAADSGFIPFSYVKDNRMTGYDVDIAIMFCKEKGYALEVLPMSFAGVLASLKAGKCDFTSSVIKTPERAESMIFSSVPVADSANVIVVMKPSERITPTPVKISRAENRAESKAPRENQPSFWEDVASSFRKTFIREERWRLFAEGIMNTMIITVSSIFCGMLLGFIAFMFCRTGSRVANVITKFSVWLIKGTPIVVLLMILYYVIFGHVNISGIVVAIIAFTLTFGTSVYRMLTFGTGAVDRGQTEAAYALGFTDMQTFFTVILPQAALHFMPSFKEEVTMLIKSTSVVGYIAVQDLTKMGDIVRSRTYEAFFPLIAVAVIYFVLAGMLNIIVNIIHVRITPSKRKPEDILRGIDTRRNDDHD